jgi:hypothetical protein
MRNKTVHLVLTEEGLAADDASMRFADVEHVYYSIVEHSSNRGFYGKEYNFELRGAGDRLIVSFAFNRAFSDSECRAVFDALVGASRRVVEPRLRSALLARIAAGETVMMGKIEVTSSGVAHRGKRVAWTEFRDSRVVPIGALRVYARSASGNAEAAFHANGGEDILLLPDLLAACASRYGSPGDVPTPGDLPTSG